ncbi:MAG TPA: hypothetical protein VKA48_10720, partial [Gammaproteobacteria bacterium]|nr:hypothetical protein [Gammaproteobacteria bacterium]
MRKISAELLAEKDACPYQIDRFQERFPDGVDPETVQPEEVYALDVRWAVHALLPPPAREAFDEATAPAREAYEEAVATARKALSEVRNPAWKARGEAEARAAIAVFREH